MRGLKKFPNELGLRYSASSFGSFVRSFSFLEYVSNIFMAQSGFILAFLTSSDARSSKVPVKTFSKTTHNV